MRHRKVFGLCPACKQPAWHTQIFDEDLYHCIKCDSLHEYDLIMKFDEWDRKRTEPAA